MTDATNGLPYLITGEDVQGEFSNRIHYLTPDGRRRSVVLDQSEDNESIRHRIGMALSQGNTGRTKGNPDGKRRSNL